MRKSISANVHVKAILNKLAAELGGVGADEGKKAARINVQTAHNVHKVMRKLEVTVKNAHLRIEEPYREQSGLPGAATARGSPSSSPSPAVAFGLCLRGVSLGLDERAGGEVGGDPAGRQWFGKKFRAMETVLLGNYCERPRCHTSRNGSVIIFSRSVFHSCALIFGYDHRFSPLLNSLRMGEDLCSQDSFMPVILFECNGATPLTSTFAWSETVAMFFHTSLEQDAK